jgi:hypothetical protein
MAEGSIPYYVLGATAERKMLLTAPQDPTTTETWMSGVKFSKPPAEPVLVRIKKGYESADLLDFFGPSTLISNRLHAALLSAGVDNLDVYDAVIRSFDNSVEHKDYKAFNLVGVIRAADMTKSEFSAELPSRLYDASIQKLEIDPNKTRGALMFRLAEYVGAVIVHERVKRAIEDAGLSTVTFSAPDQYIS